MSAAQGNALLNNFTDGGVVNAFYETNLSVVGTPGEKHLEKKTKTNGDFCKVSRSTEIENVVEQMDTYANELHLLLMYDDECGTESFTEKQLHVIRFALHKIKQSYSINDIPASFESGTSDVADVYTVSNDRKVQDNESHNITAQELLPVNAKLALQMLSCMLKILKHSRNKIIISEIIRKLPQVLSESPELALVRDINIARKVRFLTDLKRLEEEQGGEKLNRFQIRKLNIKHSIKNMKNIWAPSLEATKTVIDSLTGILLNSLGDSFFTPSLPEDEKKKWDASAVSALIGLSIKRGSLSNLLQVIRIMVSKCPSSTVATKVITNKSKQNIRKKIYPGKTKEIDRDDNQLSLPEKDQDPDENDDDFELYEPHLEDLERSLRELADARAEAETDNAGDIIQTSGVLYTFGKGDHGKLGHGFCKDVDPDSQPHTHEHCPEGKCTENIKYPRQVMILEEERIVKVASLSTHSVAVTNTGKLFTWGNGDKHRLGHGSTAKEYLPRIVNVLKNKPPVVDIACGLGHTLCLLKNGQVYAWGNGGNGRLGVGDMEDRKTACLVKHFAYSEQDAEIYKNVLDNEELDTGKGRHQTEIVHLFCGASHSLAVSRDGKCFSWGKNNQGQCGHGTVSDQLVPRLIETLCTTSKYPASRKGDLSNDISPENLDNLFDNVESKEKSGKDEHDHNFSFFNNSQDLKEQCEIKMMAGGWEHSLALTKDGRLFSFGSGYKDSRRSALPPVLGHGGTERELLPRQIMALQDENIVYCACGWDHSIAISNQGEVFTWGAGTNGKLGHGDEESKSLPEKIKSISKEGNGESVKIVQAEAGCEHSVAISEEGYLYTWGHGDSGRLGHGNLRTEKVPKRVESLVEDQKPVITVAVGDKYNLVLVEPGLKQISEKKEVAEKVRDSKRPSIDEKTDVFQLEEKLKELIQRSLLSLPNLRLPSIDDEEWPNWMHNPERIGLFILAHLERLGTVYSNVDTIRRRTASLRPELEISSRQRDLDASKTALVVPGMPPLCISSNELNIAVSNKQLNGSDDIKATTSLQRQFRDEPQSNHEVNSTKSTDKSNISSDAGITRPYAIQTDREGFVQMVKLVESIVNNTLFSAESKKFEKQQYCRCLQYHNENNNNGEYPSATGNRNNNKAKLVNCSSMDWVSLWCLLRVVKVNLSFLTSKSPHSDSENIDLKKFKSSMELDTNKVKKATSEEEEWEEIDKLHVLLLRIIEVSGSIEKKQHVRDINFDGGQTCFSLNAIARQLVSIEATETIQVGFTRFYPSPASRIKLLWNLLRQSSSNENTVPGVEKQQEESQQNNKPKYQVLSVLMSNLARDDALVSLVKGLMDIEIRTTLTKSRVHSGDKTGIECENSSEQTLSLSGLLKELLHNTCRESHYKLLISLHAHLLTLWQGSHEPSFQVVMLNHIEQVLDRAKDEATSHSSNLVNFVLPPLICALCVVEPLTIDFIATILPKVMSLLEAWSKSLSHSLTPVYVHLNRLSSRLVCWGLIQQASLTYPKDVAEILSRPLLDYSISFGEESLSHPFLCLQQTQKDMIGCLDSEPLSSPKSTLSESSISINKCCHQLLNGLDTETVVQLNEEMLNHLKVPVTLLEPNQKKTIMAIVALVLKICAGECNQADIQFLTSKFQESEAKPTSFICKVWNLALKMSSLIRENQKYSQAMIEMVIENCKVLCSSDIGYSQISFHKLNSQPDLLLADFLTDEIITEATLKSAVQAKMESDQLRIIGLKYLQKLLQICPKNRDEALVQILRHLPYALSCHRKNSICNGDPSFIKVTDAFKSESFAEDVNACFSVRKSEYSKDTCDLVNGILRECLLPILTSGKSNALKLLVLSSICTIYSSLSGIQIFPELSSILFSLLRSEADILKPVKEIHKEIFQFSKKNVEKKNEVSYFRSKEEFLLGSQEKSLHFSIIRTLRCLLMYGNAETSGFDELAQVGLHHELSRIKSALEHIHDVETKLDTELENSAFLLSNLEQHRIPMYPHVKKHSSSSDSRIQVQIPDDLSCGGFGISLWIYVNSVPCSKQSRSVFFRTEPRDQPFVDKANEDMGSWADTVKKCEFHGLAVHPALLLNCNENGQLSFEFVISTVRGQMGDRKTLLESVTKKVREVDILRKWVRVVAVVAEDEGGSPTRLTLHVNGESDTATELSGTSIRRCGINTPLQIGPPIEHEEGNDSNENFQHQVLVPKCKGGTCTLDTLQTCNEGVDGFISDLLWHKDPKSVVGTVLQMNRIVVLKQIFSAVEDYLDQISQAVLKLVTLKSQDDSHNKFTTFVYDLVPLLTLSRKESVFETSTAVLKKILVGSLPEAINLDIKQLMPNFKVPCTCSPSACAKMLSRELESNQTTNTKPSVCSILKYMSILYENLVGFCEPSEDVKCLLCHQLLSCSWSRYHYEDLTNKANLQSYFRHSNNSFKELNSCTVGQADKTICHKCFVFQNADSVGNTQTNIIYNIRNYQVANTSRKNTITSQIARIFRKLLNQEQWKMQVSHILLQNKNLLTHVLGGNCDGFVPGTTVTTSSGIIGKIITSYTAVDILDAYLIQKTKGLSLSHLKVLKALNHEQTSAVDKRLCFAVTKKSVEAAIDILISYGTNQEVKERIKLAKQYLQKETSCIKGQDFGDSVDDHIDSLGTEMNEVNDRIDIGPQKNTPSKVACISLMSGKATEELTLLDEKSVVWVPCNELEEIRAELHDVENPEYTNALIKSAFQKLDLNFLTKNNHTKNGSFGFRDWRKNILKDLIHLRQQGSALTALARLSEKNKSIAEAVLTSEKSLVEILSISNEDVLNVAKTIAGPLMKHEETGSFLNSLLTELNASTSPRLIDAATTRVWEKLQLDTVSPFLATSKLMADELHDITGDGPQMFQLESMGGFVLIDNDLLRVQSMGNFPSVRVRFQSPQMGVANTESSGLGLVSLSKGVWFYEVLLLSDGLMQIGWADAAYRGKPEEGKGVGDHPHSWAIDGYRGKKWNGESQEYGTGECWKIGDVIGCLLDMNKLEMRFYLNGEDLGVAFSNFETLGGLFPAASFTQNQSVRFNLGSSTKPFVNPPKLIPFQSLEAASPKSDSLICPMEDEEDDFDKTELKLKLQMEVNMMEMEMQLAQKTLESQYLQHEVNEQEQQETEQSSIQQSVDTLNSDDENKEIRETNIKVLVPDTLSLQHQCIRDSLVCTGHPIEVCSKVAEEAIHNEIAENGSVNEATAIEWAMRKLTDKVNLAKSNQKSDENIVNHSLLEEETCESVFSETATETLDTPTECTNQDSLSKGNWLSMALSSDGIASIRRARTLFEIKENESHGKERQKSKISPLLLLVEQCEDSELLVLYFILSSMNIIYCARMLTTKLLYHMSIPESGNIKKLSEYMKNSRVRLMLIEYIKLSSWRGSNLGDSIKYEDSKCIRTRHIIEKTLGNILLFTQSREKCCKTASFPELLLSTSFNHLKRASARQYDLVCWGRDGAEGGNSSISSMLMEKSSFERNLEEQELTNAGNVICLKNNYFGKNHLELSDKDALSQPNVEWAVWILKCLMDCEDYKRSKNMLPNGEDKGGVLPGGIYSSRILISLLNMAATPNMPLKDAIFRLCARIVSHARKHLISTTLSGKTELTSINWPNMYLDAVTENKLMYIFTTRLRKERPHRAVHSAFLKGLTSLLVSIRLLRDTARELNHRITDKILPTKTDKAFSLNILDVSSDTVTLSWLPCAASWKDKEKGNEGITDNEDEDNATSPQYSLKDKEYIIQYGVGACRNQCSKHKSASLSHESIEDTFDCYDDNPHNIQNHQYGDGWASCKQCQSREWKMLVVLGASPSIPTRYICSGLSPDTPYRFRLGLRTCQKDSPKNAGTSSYDFSEGEDVVWGPVRRVDTELGPLLMFSQNACGRNLQLSSKNMSVTNTVNKKWNAVRASTGFTRGIHNWSVYINKCVSKNIFVGVVTAGCSLENYVGADRHGWGYLANKAIWHNKGKVRSYGELFKEGDYIGVTLDLDEGIISFSRNGTDLGIAMEGINQVGELFPAVSLYNKDDKVTLILPKSSDNKTLATPCNLQSSKIQMPGIALANARIGRLAEAISIIEALQSRSNLVPDKNAEQENNCIMSLHSRTMERIAFRCKSWMNGWLSTSSSEALKVLAHDSGCSDKVAPSLLFSHSEAFESWGINNKNSPIKTAHGEGRIVGVSNGRLYYKVPWIIVPSLVQSMKDACAISRLDRSIKVFSSENILEDEFDDMASASSATEVKQNEGKTEMEGDLKRKEVPLSRLVVPWSINSSYGTGDTILTTSNLENVNVSGLDRTKSQVIKSSSDEEDNCNYDEITGLISRFEGWTIDMDTQLVQYLNALLSSRNCDINQLQWKHITPPSASLYPALGGISLFKIRERTALFIHLNQLLQETIHLTEICHPEQSHHSEWSPGQIITSGKQLLLQNLKFGCIELLRTQTSFDFQSKEMMTEQPQVVFEFHGEPSTWTVLDQIGWSFDSCDVTVLQVFVNDKLAFSGSEALKMIINTAVKEATRCNYSSSSLFWPSANMIEKVGTHRRCYIINSNSTMKNKASSLQMDRFRAFGRIIRAAIKHNIALSDVSLSGMFWKSVAGEKKTLDDLQMVNYNLALLLKEIRKSIGVGSKTDLRGGLARLKRDISVPTSEIQGKTLRTRVLTELGESVVSVTEENLEDFIDAWESWLLYGEDEKEVRAIREGIGLEILTLIESHNFKQLLK